MSSGEGHGIVSATLEPSVMPESPPIEEPALFFPVTKLCVYAVGDRA